MNYKKSLLYLEKIPNYEKTSYYNYKKAYNLDRVKRLLSYLGNPQGRYLSVIISGTKGKGSTATILASILSKSGKKTGLFISPHLISVRERIQIGKAPISEKEFSEGVSLIKRVIDRYRLNGLTFFEIITSLAFLYFAKRHVDIAVLEVGLGGRLDATNVAPARIAVITPVSYDHTHILGDSIEKISREKAGIIKERSYVVSAPQTGRALKVIMEAARYKKARLLYIGNDITCGNLRVSLNGTDFDAKTAHSFCKNLHLSLIGRHQALNSLSSLGVAEILNRHFYFDIKESDIRGALKQVEFAGRFQIISKRPYLILDGAHNKASASALKDTVKRVFSKKAKIFLVLGASSDKDIEGIGEALCPLAEKVIFTKANSPRSSAPEDLANSLKRFCKDSYVSYDAGDALVFAKAFAGRGDVILVTGSLFLIGDALKILS